MKLKYAIVVMVAAVSVGLLVTQSGNAAPSDSALVATHLAASALGQEEKTPEYVGSNKCKMCHFKEYKSWSDTPHAKAFNVLKAGEDAEAKKKFNLEPDKDYTKDAKCLECHTVGYDKPGGYAIPEDEKAAKKMENFEGVGCEDCHGPGSIYGDTMKTVMKEKRKYTFEEFHKEGLEAVTTETCQKCHNDKSPTYDENKKIDFEKEMKNPEVVHEHVELKLKSE